MNFAIGEWFAQAAEAAMQAAGLKAADIHLIGSHGQTVYHSLDANTPVRSTLQIGEAAVIAERTGISVVADFRVADVAAGGQGAPLVSYVDWLLLRHPSRTRGVQNIGGIGNVTYLPLGEDPDQVLSFDTGPGNMLIDYAAQQASQGALTYDVDGRLGSQGQVSMRLLDVLMSHPYLEMPLPKTTGREQFGEFYGEEIWGKALQMGLSGPDVVATLTAFTAASIATSYRRFLPTMPDEVILGGGGANNPVLVERLRRDLSPAAVLRQEDLGFSSDAKEAVAFAVLAYETLHGRPGNLPSCTFARHPVVMGKIVPGRIFRGKYL
jgi:anhydro-N-acetylmuramic acid kinase